MYAKSKIVKILSKSIIVRGVTIITVFNQETVSRIWRLTSMLTFIFTCALSLILSALAHKYGIHKNYILTHYKYTETHS